MELSDIKKSTIVVIYYIAKLKEFGLIDNIPFSITGKGFDIAYDLIESGFKVPLEDIGGIIKASDKNITPETFDAIFTMVVKIQEVGISNFKEVVEEFYCKYPEYKQSK